MLFIVKERFEFLTQKEIYPHNNKFIVVLHMLQLALNGIFLKLPFFCGLKEKGVDWNES